MPLPLRALACLWACLCACLPGHLARAAAPLVVEERGGWTGGAEVHVGLQCGDLRAAARRDSDHAAAGLSLPWLQAGPLAAGGMLRIVSDPLAFSIWSPVFHERTGLALDASLRSARQGVLIMPWPGLLGLFVRSDGRGGSAWGALARVPLGTGVDAEGLFCRSRPPPRGIPEDWYFDRGPFPGGEVTHFASRLRFSVSALGLSLAAGASVPSHAPAGSFVSAWVRARSPAVEAAALVSGATPAYRSPDGECLAARSLVSLGVRLGADRQDGMLEAAWSRRVDRPGFVPGRQVPVRDTLRLELGRQMVPGPGVQVEALIQAEKEVAGNADGTRSETVRCSSALSAEVGPVDARASASRSGSGETAISVALAVQPSRWLRLGLEGRLAQAPDNPSTVSASVSVSVASPAGRYALEAGLREWPVQGGPPLLPGRLRVTVSTTVRLQ